jgi:hypothetical protein
MTVSEFMKQAIPATLTAKVTEAFKLLASVDKITWPTVPATGYFF